MLHPSLRVHHAATGYILLRLPAQEGEASGFCRLTVAGAGGDGFAAKILPVLATQQTAAVVIPDPSRVDAKSGYVDASLDLAQVCADLTAIARPVLRAAVQLTFRKAVVAPLGAAVVAKVVQAAPTGIVLRLPNGVTGVAPYPRAADGDAASRFVAGENVTARCLSFDSNVFVAACSVDDQVVVRAPAGDADVAAALGALHPGSYVDVRVLSIGQAEPTPAGAVRIAVAETIGATPETATGLVYVLLRDADAKASVDELASVLPLGGVARVVVRFMPPHAALAAAPFCIAEVAAHASPFLPLCSSPLFALPLARHAGAKALSVSFAHCDPARQKGLAAVARRRAQIFEGASDAVAEAQAPKVRRRDLEEAIDAYERHAPQAPTTPEGFQKLLLATPHNSLLWTQYMAHLLSVAQTDQARDVAEKALATIPNAKTAEQLNIWVAYMNLECLHGTTESLNTVFRRALQHNDEPLVVYERLADILHATRKKEQLLDLCRAMVSKFASNARVWERYGRVLIDQDKRDVLKRLLKQLQQNEALRAADRTTVMQHLGVHEFRNGTPSHGRLIFESLVAQRAKRSDVWNVYLDQELSLLARKEQSATVASVRTLFQRAASVALPPNAMQQLLARFMRFEEAHGGAEDIERVKEAARAYVERKLGDASGTAAAPPVAVHNQSERNDDAAEADEGEE
jgi:rRNA biogenesis protein RRP5